MCVNNTLITYLYRDACNYKVLNEVIVSGELTKDRIKEMMALLYCGEYFIPSQVGLPEERFSRITDDDHCWFEIEEKDFQITNKAPTIDMTAKELYLNFINVNGNWDDMQDYGRDYYEV